MNRENKFRAWDKINEIMIYDVSVCNERNSVIESDFFIDCASSVSLNEIGFEDCEVMQYTGLKDKNKKEVCVGDICKLSHWIGDGTEDIKELIIIIGGMFKGSFTITDTNTDNYLFNEMNTMYICDLCIDVDGGGEEGDVLEVIGNIYNNPELLQK